jgi:hypothetical protein
MVILSLFEPCGDSLGVHIVASGEKADATILSLADKKNTYVLSNDRYVDFLGQEAVKKQRLLRFEMTERRVMIHSLKIDVKY